MKIEISNNHHYYIGFSMDDYRSLMKLKPDNIRKVHIFMIPGDPKCVNKQAIDALCYCAWKLHYNKINKVPDKYHGNMKVIIHTFGNKVNENYLAGIIRAKARRFYVDKSLVYHSYINCRNEFEVERDRHVLWVTWYKEYTSYKYIKKQSSPLKQLREFVKKRALFTTSSYEKGGSN